MIQGREDLEAHLVIMHTQEGWTIRVLAMHFSISRNMVRRILTKHEKLWDQGRDILLTPRRAQPTRRSGKLAPFEDTI